MSVGPRAEKLNIVSNDHGCDFSVFDPKYPFWANLLKNEKKSKLSVEAEICDT